MQKYSERNLEIDNRETDHNYKQQIDETNHQDHRMTWILLAMTAIFAVLPLKFFPPKDADLLAPLFSCVIIMVGFCFSVSSIYSMIIGELSIGNILDTWTEYKKKGKLNELEHMIIAAPPAALESKLSFLSMYTFTPKVFCSAWITIGVIFLTHYRVVNLGVITIGETVVLFCTLLLVLIAVSFAFSSYMRYRITKDRYEQELKRLEGEICLLKSKVKVQRKQLNLRNMAIVTLGILLSCFAINRVYERGKS